MLLHRRAIDNFTSNCLHFGVQLSAWWLHNSENENVNKVVVVYLNLAFCTLTCLKSVPRSDTRKERFRRSLRVPRKERQSRSCHGMGKFIFFYFFSFSGIFLDGWFSARAKIMGLPLIRVDSTFVLGYCSYFGMHTLTLVIKFANIFEKWFFFKKSCCRCL